MVVKARLSYILYKSKIYAVGEVRDLLPKVFAPISENIRQLLDNKILYDNLFSN